MFLPPTIAQIRASLSTVHDPELGLSIVDLGMVRRIEKQDQSWRIVLTPTTLLCPLQTAIEGEVRRRLQKAFPNVVFRVQWETNPPWSVEELSKEAKRKLGWTP